MIKTTSVLNISLHIGMLNTTAPTVLTSAISESCADSCLTPACTQASLLGNAYNEETVAIAGAVILT